MHRNDSQWMPANSNQSEILRLFLRNFRSSSCRSGLWIKSVFIVSSGTAVLIWTSNLAVSIENKTVFQSDQPRSHRTMWDFIWVKRCVWMFQLKVSTTGLVPAKWCEIQTWSKFDLKLIKQHAPISARSNSKLCQTLRTVAVCVCRRNALAFCSKRCVKSAVWPQCELTGFVRLLSVSRPALQMWPTNWRLVSTANLMPT